MIFIDIYQGVKFPDDLVHGQVLDIVRVAALVCVLVENKFSI